MYMPENGIIPDPTSVEGKHCVKYDPKCYYCPAGNPSALSRNCSGQGPNACVSAMASAPQNVTRIAPTVLPAPS